MNKNHFLLIIMVIFLLCLSMVLSQSVPEQSTLSNEKIQQMGMQELRDYGLGRLSPEQLSFVHPSTLVNDFTRDDARLYFSSPTNGLPRSNLNPSELVLYGILYPNLDMDVSLIDDSNLEFGDGFISTDRSIVTFGDSAVTLFYDENGHLTDGKVVFLSGEFSLNQDGSYRMSVGSELETTQGDYLYVETETNLYLASSSGYCEQCVYLNHDLQEAFLHGDGIYLALSEKADGWGLSLAGDKGDESFILDSRTRDRNMPVIFISGGKMTINPLLDDPKTGFASIDNQFGHSLLGIENGFVVASCPLSNTITGAATVSVSPLPGCKRTGTYERSFAFIGNVYDNYLDINQEEAENIWLSMGRQLPIDPEDRDFHYALIREAQNFQLIMVMEDDQSVDDKQEIFDQCYEDVELAEMEDQYEADENLQREFNEYVDFYFDPAGTGKDPESELEIREGTNVIFRIEAGSSFVDIIAPDGSRYSHAISDRLMRQVILQGWFGPNEPTDGDRAEALLEGLIH